MKSFEQSWFWHITLAFEVWKHLKKYGWGPDSGLLPFDLWNYYFNLCDFGTGPFMLQIWNIWNDPCRLSCRHLQQIIQWKFFVFRVGFWSVWPRVNHFTLLSQFNYFNCLKCDHLKKLLAVKKLCKNNNGLKMSAINCFSCFALRTWKLWDFALRGRKKKVFFIPEKVTWGLQQPIIRLVRSSNRKKYRSQHEILNVKRIPKSAKNCHVYIANWLKWAKWPVTKNFAHTVGAFHPAEELEKMFY